MPNPRRSVRILLVEDDAEVRAVISAAVAAEPAFRLTAVSSRKGEAIALRDETLDIALIGLDLAEGSGLEVVEAVSRCRPALLVIVIGTAEDKEGIFLAMEAGATGCLVKEALLRQTAVQVNSVIAGMLFGLIQDVKSVYKTGKACPRCEDLPNVQRQILGCLLRGLSNKEIARDLILTSYNVEYHMKCLRKRFSVRNRAQLVSAAMALLAN